MIRNLWECECDCHTPGMKIFEMIPCCFTCECGARVRSEFHLQAHYEDGCWVANLFIDTLFGWIRECCRPRAGIVDLRELV